jgi:hypothetical protein
MKPGTIRMLGMAWIEQRLMGPDSPKAQIATERLAMDVRHVLHFRQANGLAWREGDESCSLFSLTPRALPPILSFPYLPCDCDSRPSGHEIIQALLRLAVYICLPDSSLAALKSPPTRLLTSSVSRRQIPLL